MATLGVPTLVRPHERHESGEFLRRASVDSVERRMHQTCVTTPTTEPRMRAEALPTDDCGVFPGRDLDREVLIRCR
jgi:hypothetical protein